MIEVKKLKKKFERINSRKEKEEFYAVNDISFTASEKQIIGILGPNGAGKTTLLRMIAGILKPTSGQVIFNDLNYDKNAIDIKRQLAYLSGNTKIYNTISTYELLKMCSDIYGVDDDTASKRINDIVKRFNMKEFLHSKIEKLSTGQIQRVNIARCLVHDPKYYIFDEATAGLDIIASQVILKFIKEEKQKGKTIIYSTHYMEEAENICDYVIMINKGKVIKEGTPDIIKKETDTSNLRDAFFALIQGGKNE